MRNGGHVSLSDGASVLTLALHGSDEWHFVFKAPGSGGDCDYTRWSSGRGVIEIGRSGCSAPEPLQPMWQLNSPVGFFRE